MASKTCFESEPASPLARVILTQQGRDRFTVTYGRQVKSGLTYAAAAAELGACIMHRAACEGTLDNRHKGER